MIAGILGAHAFTRRRFAAGTRGSDGRYVPGAATDSTLSGSIQPDGKAQTTDRYGERSTSNWRCLTTGSLRPVDQGAQTLADRVIWRGVAYEVRADKEWTAVLPHQTFGLVQVQESDPGPRPEPEESVLQGVRAWLRATLGISDAQVIPGDDKGPRPPLPYLVVTVVSADRPQGEDTRQPVEGDAVTVTGGAVGDDYVLSVFDGTEIRYTRQAGDTDSDVAAGLLAEALAVPGLTGTAEGAALSLISLGDDAPGAVVVEGDLSVDPIPAEIAAGMRVASVDLDGYGALAAEWLSSAVAALRLSTGIAACAAAGIAVRADGGASENRAQMLDTAIEHRWSRTVAVDYYLRGAGQPLTPLSTATLSGVLSSAVAGDLDLDITVPTE